MVCSTCPRLSVRGIRARLEEEVKPRWMKKVWGNKTVPSSDAALARARADRWEKEST